MSEEQFTSKVHLIGMVSLVLAIIANFLPVSYLAFVYNIAPSMSEFVQIYTAVAAAYGFNWIIQPPSFFPVLGIVGCYIAFFSGSLADVRVPVVTAAHKVTGTEPGTPEGDAVGSIAVTASVFVTFTLFTIFVAVGNVIIGILPKFVLHAFTYVVPAIFSAVFVNMASRNLKMGIPVFIICCFMTFIFPMIGIKKVFSNILAIIVAMFYAKLMFDRKNKQQNK